nr:LysR substrate-binding domain-containing protein [uncultured Roseateles sp.]
MRLDPFSLKLFISVVERGSIAAAATLENEADVGICTASTPALGLEVFPYHEDELVLLVPRGHALARKRTVALIDTLDHEPAVPVHALRRGDAGGSQAAGR